MNLSVNCTQMNSYQILYKLFVSPVSYFLRETIFNIGPRKIILLCFYSVVCFYQKKKGQQNRFREKRKLDTGLRYHDVIVSRVNKVQILSVDWIYDSGRFPRYSLEELCFL